MWEGVILGLREPMRRREFITLIGGAVAGWPLAAHAQQPGKLPTIGFFGQTTRSAASEWVAAFLLILVALR
jgi:putative tryptophan/tyrosine transport system substrate-binding protein